MRSAWKRLSLPVMLSMGLLLLAVGALLGIVLQVLVGLAVLLASGLALAALGPAGLDFRPARVTLSQRTLALVLVLGLQVGLVGALLVSRGRDISVAQAQGGGTVRYVAPGGSCGSASPCYSSVQAAVNAANGGDEIRIATGTYNENVTINKTLTLRGGYTTTDWTVANPISYPTVLNGGGAGRVIAATTSGIDLTIENLEITNGTGGIQICGQLDQACDINATIRNCYIHDNNAPNEGGGIYAKLNSGYTVRIENCRIVGNTAGGTFGGGGVFAYYNPNVILVNNVITGNTASGGSQAYGGGAYVAGASCTVTGNVVAQNSGTGGLYVSCNSPTVNDNQVWGNSSGPYETAGGLYVEIPTSGSGLVSGNVITNNSHTCGSCSFAAGGLTARGSLTVRGNVITGNTGAYAVYAGGNVVFENNLIADNQPGAGYDAVRLNPDTNANCGTNDARTYRFVHNTVARNGNVTAVNVPAPSNTNCPATAYITNTIVYSHALGVEAVSTSAAYVAHSLLSNTTNISGNVTLGAGMYYSEPLFLADGYHLAAGSPARDAGTGSGFDYADVDDQPRLMGLATDIGADEWPYTATVSLTKARQESGTAQAGQPISYVLTVSNATTSVWRPDVRVVDVITSPYPLAGVQGIGGNANVSCQAGSNVVTCTYQNVPTDTAYVATVVVTPAIPTQQSTQGFASADNLNIAIPDNGCGSNSYAEHTIAVNGSGTIADVDVFVKSITHTYDSDLNIYVRGPDGTQVDLSTGNGGSGANYVNTVFDDEAATAITAGSAPFTGRYKPEGSLSAFDGKDPNGNWTLRVCDGASADTGTLNGWGLTLTLQSPLTQTVSWVITDTASLEVLDAYDPVITDNVAGPVTTTVTYTPPKPDVWVSKSAPKFAKPNQVITYSVRWGNQGGADAENVVLTDVLPAEVTFGAADGNPTRNGRHLTWTLGTVSAGMSGTYVITVTTNSGLADGTVITNTAGIATSTGGDPAVNNTDVATTTIYQLGGVNIVLNKQATPQATPYSGQSLPNEIVYTVTVANTGQVDANVTMEDPIPKGTQYVAGSARVLQGGGNVRYDSSGKVIWEGVVPVGQSAMIEFRVLVVSCEGVECGRIRNVATAVVQGVSYQWTAQAETIVKCPDLRVEAQIPKNVIFRPVGYHEYEVVVSYDNRGDFKAPGTRIVANLQNANSKFVSANPLPSQKPNDRQWHWDVGDLDPLSGNQLRILVRAKQWDNNGYPISIGIDTAPEWYECQSKQNDNSAVGTTYPARVTLDKKGRIWYNPNGKDGPTLGVEWIIYGRYENAHPDKPPMDKMRVRDEWPNEFRLRRAEWKWGGPLYFLYQMKRQSRRASGITTTYAWENSYAIVEGSQVYGRLNGDAPAYSLQAGKTITNVAKTTGTIKSGNEVIGVMTEQVSTGTVEVPLLAPRFIQPERGQVCPGPVPVKVQAQPGLTVQVKSGSLGLLAQGKTDQNGLFEANIQMPQNDVIFIYALAYAPDGEAKASGPLKLDSRDVHWDPHTSEWVGTVKAGPLKGQFRRFTFRDKNGEYSTKDWQMPGVYGFWDTTVYITPCGCPAGQRQEIVIEADGVEYKGQYIESLKQFRVDVTGSAHDVKIKSRCVDEKTGKVMSEQVNGGQILIDPDGFVFNVDKGGSYDPNTGMFSPVEAIPGVTVTAYVSVPEWGGWVPWPAHLYGQTNPQVTDDKYPDGITTTGYFAFFTPPGYYYLEVEGIPGYQRWRSPVVQVVTQVVHVNVPYTPWVETAAATVTLTPDGPDPAVVTVPVGSAVQWVSQVRETDTITDVVRWTENPILRLRSDLDPLQDAKGFDAGYLEPGRGYRRQFSWPGEYTYTDAAGHTGKVVVTGPAACTAVSDVSLAGPDESLVGVPSTFTATVSPETATTPVEYVWDLGDGRVITHTAGISDTVQVTWYSGGRRTVRVTARDACGNARQAARPISVGYKLYLPVVTREGE